MVFVLAKSFAPLSQRLNEGVQPHNTMKQGLYSNIKAKQDRIKGGSGEKMNKVGSKAAPTAKNFKDAAKTAKKPK